ncbi:hypothetical protein DFH09DRAFT_1304951 [Mycena vulgaris]|nr:hypothetical protein DFH09DRAFT_1304951 [Mycena vulgaris]
MASHTGLSLPNELTNRIILELPSEPEALASCALVCRAWLSSVQRRLFSKLTIHERNCAEIVEYLKSTTPNIAQYVQQLNVYLWGDLRSNINRTAGSANPLLHLLLPHISHFTYVKELEFDGCRDFHSEHWDEVWTDLLASAFPSITHLTVHYLMFEDLPDLVDLVSSFPQLTHLTAADIDIAEASHEYSNEEQEPYDGSKTPPPVLENLHYTSGQSFASGMGPFLSWLAAGPQTFKTLYLDLDAEAGDINAGVELIGAAGKSLKTLFLSFSDQWQLWEGFELSGNSNLRSLVVRDVSDFGGSLVEILESLNSPLEHLILGGVDEMDEETWPNLVNVLTSFEFLLELKLYLTSEDRMKNLADEHPELFKDGIAVLAVKQHYEW